MFVWGSTAGNAPLRSGVVLRTVTPGASSKT